MHRRLIAILLSLFLSWPAVAVARAVVSGMRVAGHPDGVTRVVFDLSQSVDFRVRRLVNPFRVVVDTEAATWLAGAAPRLRVGAVADVRYRDAGEGGEVELILARPAEVRHSFLIPPGEGLGWRLVIDLKDVSRQAFLAAVAPQPNRAASAAAASPPDPGPLPEARPQPESAANAGAPTAPAGGRMVAVVSSTALLAQGGAQAAPSPVPPEPPSPAPQPPASGSVAASDVPRVAAPPLPQPRPGAEGEAAPGAAGPVLAAVIPPPREQPVPVADPQAEPLPVTQVAAPVPVPDPQAIAPRRHKGKPIVVIDPGHGGIDPGAIGISGVYEKNITLAEARDLREHLERTGRYRVYLTRDRDVFVPLHDRVVLARQYGADLFISLHADVQRDSQIRGLSVYTLSQTASDAESQALADKENKADLIAGIDLSHESSDVANILIDLAQRETMNRSSGFATDVVESAGHAVPLLVNTHRFAGFAVLKAPDVPAVLIEMGYLSNETDEHNLRQPQYRDRLARMLSHAIDLFFQEERKERRS